jgi:hypothetical protein
MTDPRIDIWNLLHDGEITVAGRDADALVLFVSIAYLRSGFHPIGDSFALRLGGFRSARVEGSDGGRSDLKLNDLPTCHLTILSALSASMPVEIEHTMGKLILDFDSLDIELDTGARVEIAELAAAAKRYWSDFEERAKRPNTSLERTRDR